MKNKHEINNNNKVLKNKTKNIFRRCYLPCKKKMTDGFQN